MDNHKQEAERIIELFSGEMYDHLYCDCHLVEGIAKAARGCAINHCMEIIDALGGDFYFRSKREEWTKVLEHIKQL